jgi:hypothetical protein
MTGPFPERIAQPGMLVTSPRKLDSEFFSFFAGNGAKKASKKISIKGHNQKKITYALKQSEAG